MSESGSGSIQEGAPIYSEEFSHSAEKSKKGSLIRPEGIISEVEVKKTSEPKVKDIFDGATTPKQEKDLEKPHFERDSSTREAKATHRSRVVKSLMHQGVPKDVAKIMDQGRKVSWNREDIMQQAEEVNQLDLWRLPLSGEVVAEYCLNATAPEGKLLVELNSKGEVRTFHRPVIVDSLYRQGIPEDVAKLMAQGRACNWQEEALLHQARQLPNLEIWKNPQTGEVIAEYCINTQGPEGRTFISLTKEGEVNIVRRSRSVNELVRRGVPDKVARQLLRGWKKGWESFVEEKYVGECVVLVQKHRIAGLEVRKDQKTEDLFVEYCINPERPEEKQFVSIDSRGAILSFSRSKFVDSLIHQEIPEEVAKQVEQGWKNKWAGLFREEQREDERVLVQNHSIQGLKIYKNPKTDGLVGDLLLRRTNVFGDKIVIGVARFTESGEVYFLYRQKQEGEEPASGVELASQVVEKSQQERISDDLVGCGVPFETAKIMAEGCLNNWKDFFREETINGKVYFKQIHDVVGLKVYRDPRSGKIVGDFGSDTLGAGGYKRAKQELRLGEGGKIEYRVRVSKKWERIGGLSLEQANEIFEASIAKEMSKRKALEEKGEIPYCIRIISLQYISVTGEIKTRYEMEQCDGDLSSLVEVELDETTGAYIHSHPEKIGEAFLYFSHALKAVKVMHERGFVHRDLKFGNILHLLKEKSTSGGKTVLEKQGVLSDFELSARLPSKKGAKDGDPFEPSSGSPGTQAPELFLDDVKENDTSMDMFSIGIMLLQFAHPDEGETLVEEQTQLLDKLRELNGLINQCDEQLEKYRKEYSLTQDPDLMKEVERLSEEKRRFLQKIDTSKMRYVGIWDEIRTNLLSKEKPLQGDIKGFDTLIARLIDPDPQKRPSIDVVEEAVSIYTQTI